ncbi:MAG: sigma-70 family RNA polymerase sigma factor [Candidatus Latescibacteria bacterium]|nr:sigma-70 family RNA polymerase sigma factor [Candidatus Latescibacterota bacterium]
MADGPDAPSRDPSRWVDEHGDALFRFAVLRVRDADLAADLVQDTLLSALKGIGGFRGGSSVRTWLTGILKHKIIDYYRRNRSEVLHSDLAPEGDELAHAESLRSSWKESPSSLVENREFWSVLTGCLDGLPEAHRRAFSMREFDGLSGEEIRKVLDVTPTNLWVMLHRARTKLRRCLESNWFEEK